MKQRFSFPECKPPLERFTKPTANAARRTSWATRFGWSLYFQCGVGTLAGMAIGCLSHAVQNPRLAELLAFATLIGGLGCVYKTSHNYVWNPAIRSSCRNTEALSMSLYMIVGICGMWLVVAALGGVGYCAPLVGGAVIGLVALLHISTSEEIESMRRKFTKHTDANRTDTARECREEVCHWLFSQDWPVSTAGVLLTTCGFTLIGMLSARLVAEPLWSISVFIIGAVCGPVVCVVSFSAVIIPSYLRVVQAHYDEPPKPRPKPDVFANHEIHRQGVDAAKQAHRKCGASTPFSHAHKYN